MMQRERTGLFVLVVDDQPDIAETMAMVLRLLGFQAAAAHPGAQALEIALSHRPDAVLVDVGMPIMNGYEVATCIGQLFPQDPAAADRRDGLRRRRGSRTRRAGRI